MRVWLTALLCVVVQGCQVFPDQPPVSQQDGSAQIPDVQVDVTTDRMLSDGHADTSPQPDSPFDATQQDTASDPGDLPDVVEDTEQEDVVADAMVDVGDADLCNNHNQDPNETDIDCGGGVCKKCQKNQHCHQNSDCESDFCLTSSEKCK